MADKTFSIDDPNAITSYVSQVITKVGLSVEDAVNQTLDKLGKEGAKRVKALAPKKTGKYAKGWRSRVQKMQADGSFELVIYNAKYGWLAHLVEKGHPVFGKNDAGVPVKVADARATEHVGPVNDWIQGAILDELADAVAKEISKQIK